jgi:hypothetical protein
MDAKTEMDNGVAVIIVAAADECAALNALKGLRLEKLYALPLGLLLVFERGCGILAASVRTAGVEAQRWAWAFIAIVRGKGVVQ